jgi:endonuclease G
MKSVVSSLEGITKIRANMENEEMRKQREDTLKWFYSGKSLMAEYDEKRKISYVQARTGIKDRDLAKRVADYDKSAMPLLTEEQKVAVNSLYEEDPEFLDVYFVEAARAAASAVGKVVDRALDCFKATGFMISDSLFLTNNHVIENQSKAENSFVEFNYELDVTGKQKPVTRFAFAPDDFFITSPEGDLDFTIVAVGKRIFGEGELSDFGYCPITETPNKHSLGILANIVGHPDGKFKQIAIRKNRIAARNDDVLLYYTNTEIGSSGSPVFNDQWKPIALHHWGVPSRDTINGKPAPKETNEGIRISAIVNRINSEKKNLPANQQLLITHALDSGKSFPSMLKSA